MDNWSEQKAIAGRFGITEVKDIEQIYKSSWAVNDAYVLKKCGSLDELEKSVWFSDYLLGSNIPVKKYYKADSGKYYVKAHNGYYCLSNKIKGHHISSYKVKSHNTGIYIGRIIAKLHRVLAKMKPPFEIYDSDYHSELYGWIGGRLSENKVDISASVIAACQDFEALYARLPRQIIHRDMHLGNLIFKDDVFKGYIDFDISQINARIFDVCYMGTTLLAYVNRDDNADIARWQNVFSGVLVGYHQIIPITDDEKSAIPLMMVLIELAFTAFFARENNPEVIDRCVKMTEWLYENQSVIQEIVSRFEKETEKK